MMRPDPGNTDKILWIHNFPKKTGSGGVWMYNQFEFMKDKIDLYYLNNLRNPICFIRHIVKLFKLSKKYKIVHAQYGSAVGFITCLLPCRRILSLKGSDWYRNPNPALKERIRIYWGGLLTRISVPRFHYVIVMSDSMKQQVIKKYPKSKVVTIVDPIDLEVFYPKDISRSGSVKKVLFASVTLDNPIKRFPLAMSSFQKLQERMPDTELVTMSKIPHAEVCDFMNKVDVLLLTSTHEGWPNVVKEILACNKPFVSTDVSDLKRIADETENCFVCDADPEQLGEALYRSLNTKSENLRKFVQPFNMKETISKLMNIYRSLD